MVDDDLPGRIPQRSMRCMAPSWDERQHAACPGGVCECRCHEPQSDADTARAAHVADEE
jgi:hypothetical protein